MISKKIDKARKAYKKKSVKDSTKVHVFPSNLGNRYAFRRTWHFGGIYQVSCLWGV